MQPMIPGLLNLNNPGGVGGLPGGLPGLAGLPSLGGGLPTLPGARPGLAGLPGLGGLNLPLNNPSLLQAQAKLLANSGLLRPLGNLGTAPGLGLGGTAPGLGGLGLSLGLPGMRPVNSSTAKVPSPAGPIKIPPPGLVPPPNAATVTSTGPAPCTVYVGRISTEVSDDFVKMLLEKCGKISKWNRAADPNTSKLTSFGFCDFEDPQGVWRALEFLHDRQLCDKRLLVKCEEKAKQTIEKWKDSRKVELAGVKAKKEAAAEAKEKKEDDDNKEKDGDDKMGDEDKKDGEDGAAKEDAKDEKPLVVKPLNATELDEELKKESQDIGDELERLLKDKNKGYPEVVSHVDVSGAETQVKVDSGDAEELAKAKAAKEADDAKTAKEKEDNEKKKEEEQKAAGNNSNSKENSRPSPPKRLTRSEERRKRIEDEKKAPVSKHYRQSRRERDREQRIRDRERDIDKEYQYRIREFERGEEKRIKRLKEDLKDLETRTAPSDRDKRRFIESDLDYGRNEREERDWKRRREDRARDRAKEKEKDDADRAQEDAEMEEERRKREEEEKKIRREREEEERKKRKEQEDEERRIREEERLKREEEERKVREEQEKKDAEERAKRESEQKKQQEAAAAKLLQSVQLEMKSSADKPGGKAAGISPSGVTAMFQAGMPEVDASGKPKHKPLFKPEGPPPSTSGGGGAAAGGADVKLRDDEMRRLIQQVPTEKAKAFAYPIDWQAVHDCNIIEKKLRPWVKKKVTEYLGAEEQGMIEFIMRKVSAHTPPDSILAELEGFLDEEAENFTLKMWRMLIFEVLRVKAR